MKSLQTAIEAELKESANVLNTFISDPQNLSLIESSAKLMVVSIQSGGKIISCGNGGSCCDAMHFAEELSGRYRQDRSPIAAISISDPSHITCVGNDYGFQEVFARYVQALGNPKDTLLAISTSGNSPNVIRAIEEARKKGMTIIGLTGKDGGKMKDLCDEVIVVSHHGFADRIQEVHIKVIHIFILLIEKMLLENVS